ncbi:dual specificity mitogen-activated protein kinase kinase 5-like isoform X2 [Dreissena polymorpha]|uniref:dual specificity mitogen-activated protein kinase kinase 5-like isoform X2 n=1 Tax=Dreissena polymorpha TaxID=45954 RepID=UPI0022645608|nr:dual specificity mitogen-activated protein kinase kinase 5-like isoform X2 [Dreissena polymorpha]
MQREEVISKIIPDVTTTAFQYVDEDGEKITVRSDEELRAMFQMYECEFSEEDLEKGTTPPIVIYPRVAKTPKDRNKYDLKIKTEVGKPKTNDVQMSPFFKDQESNMTVPQSTRQSPQQYGQMMRSPVHTSPGNQHIMPASPFHASPQQYPIGGRQPSPMQIYGAASLHQSPQQINRTQAKAFENNQMNTAQLLLSDQMQIDDEHINTKLGFQGQSKSDSLKQILTCGTINVHDLQQVELIGHGNGGEVYKALYVPSRTLMAVKVIQLDVDIEVQKTILAELDILCKCNSEAIIGFYGAYFIENRISICTEYMDGGSLDQYGRIPEEILCRMAVRIVQGLLYMWSLKILHRDIKPSNILVNTRGDVKLCDFGVSTQLVKSIAMTFVGTNVYMSPERIKAENYGAPSEIWSLGVTLFELATGKFPFKEILMAENPGTVMNVIIEGNTPVLPQDVFSPELSDFVARCMQKDAIRRITHQDVLSHPLIKKYGCDANICKVLSAWITSQLQLRKSRAKDVS